MKKVMSAKEVTAFEQIPNVGKEIAKDFILLGVKTPEQLKSQDAFDLYVRLCQITKSYHDPCVLDTFLAAIEFMNEISNKYLNKLSYSVDRIESKLERLK